MLLRLEEEPWLLLFPVRRERLKGLCEKRLKPGWGAVEESMIGLLNAGEDESVPNLLADCGRGSWGAFSWAAGLLSHSGAGCFLVLLLSCSLALKSVNW